MSLFFVIMRGEYDPLLSWPFKHKVRMKECHWVHSNLLHRTKDQHKTTSDSVARAPRWIIQISLKRKERLDFLLFMNKILVAMAAFDTAIQVDMFWHQCEWL